MKKISVIFLAVLTLGIMSCGSGSTDTPGPDSAANNGIVPPSAAPGNATNPSLADTTYHADSTKGK